MAKVSEKKVIAITMGDPCGIGPEITVRTLADKSVHDKCKPLLIGDADILEQAAEKCGIKHFMGKYADFIYHVPCKGKITVETAGKVCDFAGQAAYDCIKASHLLCSKGKAHSVATAPINKEALKAANVPFIGHTEIYAALTDTKDPLTMFETRGLRVFFLTRHLSLSNAISAITADKIKDYIVRCTEALDRIGAPKGTLAVAGLNPHSGEHGLFGDEEVNIIAPAVEEMKKEGFDVEGPVSADSVFHQAYMGKYRAVLSLYHDQGHIATKTLDFERTIALTHSMPYLRTSVDHGTAFDIAWTGKASHISMVEATLLAAKYSYR
jgi:4-hydroxythreonine-4-phosphate dehydrogenase